MHAIVLTELIFYRIHEDIWANIRNFLRNFWSPGTNVMDWVQKRLCVGVGGVRPVVAVFELLQLGFAC